VHLALIALSHFIVEAEVASRTFCKIVDEEFTDEPRCLAFACPTVARCRGQPKSSSMRSSMSVDAARDKLHWPVALGRDLTSGMNQTDGSLLFFRRPRGSGAQGRKRSSGPPWVPAFAGMTIIACGYHLLESDH
jgi:hypothetical protein